MYTAAVQAPCPVPPWDDRGPPNKNQQSSTLMSDSEPDIKSDLDPQKSQRLYMETLLSAQLETTYREIKVLQGLLIEARPYTIKDKGDLYLRIGSVLRGRP